MPGDRAGREAMTGVLIEGGRDASRRNKLRSGPIRVVEQPAVLPIGLARARTNIVFAPSDAAHSKAPAFADPARRGLRIVLLCHAGAAVSKVDRRRQTARTGRDGDRIAGVQRTCTEVDVEGIGL